MARDRVGGPMTVLTARIGERYYILDDSGATPFDSERRRLEFSPLMSFGLAGAWMHVGNTPSASTVRWPRRAMKRLARAAAAGLKAPFVSARGGECRAISRCTFASGVDRLDAIRLRRGRAAPAEGCERSGSAPSPAAGSTGHGAADYVAAAGAIDLYVIKASELALQRSQALRVREVAERLIEAHRGSSAQLSLGGRRLNLCRARRSSRAIRRSSSNFTRAPVSTAIMRRRCRRRIRRPPCCTPTCRSGDSPTLVPVARALAPVMEQQQRLVSYL